MIADAVFDESPGDVRPLRFVPRASIPLEAACVVANGLRETLRELFGVGCELVVGEPAAIRGEDWSLIVQSALLFLTRGRQTDIVLVMPEPDARRLVLRAFGEGDALPDRACSTLELHALERIAARCATSFDVLCAERTERLRSVRAHEIPACVAYFDVRVKAPIPLTLGIAIARNLPDPGPSGTLGTRALDAVGIPVRAIVARGAVDAATVLALRPGDVLALETRLDAPATLAVGTRTLARGTCGVTGSQSAFRVAS